ncbi:MAG: hypothetical protein JWN00_4998 [Actinomycetia bacterium]|jgi:hypothetical protein|nr:hypothetical protein [Actinomycetes bacterium]
MCGVTGGDPGEARAHLEKRLAVVTERAAQMYVGMTDHGIETHTGIFA